MSIVLTYLLIVSMIQPAPDKKSVARERSDAFLQLLDSKDVRKAYRTMVCDLWKEQVKEEAWVAMITPWMLQRQAPPKERIFIDETPGSLPIGVTTGASAGIRFKATYAAMSLYEIVAVYTPEAGPSCVGGFWFSPAPF